MQQLLLEIFQDKPWSFELVAYVGRPQKRPVVAPKTPLRPIDPVQVDVRPRRRVRGWSSPAVGPGSGGRPEGSEERRRALSCGVSPLLLTRRLTALEPVGPAIPEERPTE
jgi:hypothetical protein